MEATRPCRLEGVIRNYPWGSRTAIPELLGRAAGRDPEAELWLGAHDSAPACAIAADGTRIPLDAWIRSDPEGVLGGEIARRFDGEMPFLLKVLAADEPLSIQAHPSAQQAREGFARENEAGVPVDAPDRCYRDPHPKPELICALAPFRALSRFRAPEDIVRRIRALSVPGLEPLIEPLVQAPDSGGLRAFFEAWMSLGEERRLPLVGGVVEAAGRAADPDGVFAVVKRLASFHPGDAGVLAPLFLHCVELAPGEAMYLPAGELHSYLEGIGVEVMASSDNVLRGGLTPKHVDVPELLATLRFEPSGIVRLRPEAVGPMEAVYATPAEAFRLSVVRVPSGRTWSSGARRGVEILLCTEGDGRVIGSDGGAVPFPRGGAVLAPAAAGAYAIEGPCVVYRATTGDLG